LALKVDIPLLEAQVSRAQARLDGLRRLPRAESQEVLEDTLEQLSTALEELRVSTEELSARNEEVGRAHQALERERRRYMELFEFAPDAYLVTDRFGTIAEANATAARLFRRRAHHLIRKPLAALIAPDALSTIRTFLTDALRGRLDRLVEAEVRVPLEGGDLNVAINATTIVGDHSNVTGFRWMFRDITTRKHNEWLRDERTQLVAFAAAVGVALTSGTPLRVSLQQCADAMVERLDAALARIWTMNASEHVLELQASAGLSTDLDGAHGRIRLGEFEVGRIAATCQPLLTNAVVGDRDIHDQEWAVREKLVAFAGYPLVVNDTLVGVMALFVRRALDGAAHDACAAAAREIALGIQQKRSELELADALQQIEAIVAAVPDVIYTLDTAARLVRWNRALEVVTGFSPQELRNRPVTSFFPETQRAAVSAAVRAAWETGYAEVESELRCKDGRVIPYAWSGAPLKNGHGTVIGLTGVGRDICERERAREALSHLSSRLIHLQDEERRRLGRELHDSTAQNLAGLGMNLSLVNRSRQRLSAGARRALDESVMLTERSLAEIRTLSYLLHPPLLDEVGVASAIRWYAEGFAQRSGIRVDMDIPSDSERLPYEVERALFRIVQESLINVHRHSGSPTVGIHFRREADTITLEITDEGHGLRGHAAIEDSDHSGRLGVGITGMRERMRQLGGRLELIPCTPGLTVRAIAPLRTTER